MAQTQSLDEAINSFIGPVSDFITSIIFYSIHISGVDVPLIVLWLITAGLFFFFYLKAINVTRLGLAINIVRGKYDDPNSKGEVNHFQALATALSGTVGLGNISGVAVAIVAGGPGATFWMVVAGFFGMMTKFAECTLGVKYRQVSADGIVSGGPMYFLRDGLKAKGFPVFGKVLAALFAVMCIGGALGGGNMFQSNQVTAQLVAETGGTASWFAGNLWLPGLILSILVGSVIIGGLKSIANVTEKIVPFMCALYVITCLYIIFAAYDKIPETFMLIMNGAFNSDAMYGGVLGVLITGFRRASFSNEAGVGSASIAHSAVKTNEPVTEGLVSLLEPFLDTIVICTMTALVIVISGTYQDFGKDGITLTSHAFSSTVDWFHYILSISVFLFAFATMISWSYYGLKSWGYLFGDGKISELIYKFIYCFFIIVGASMSLTKVVDFSDAMIFSMSIFNIIGLYLLSGELKQDMNQFLHKIDTGIIKKNQ
ncbi:alanine/glycine:cation symporter family protein [Cytophaga aurantiaca]|uniref:alanine/glycine:cation symporter family protein n=1 Tax=Cytophaga aurantiaca TaxID=29530 RepID=UPI00037E56BB|nr:alanine/glycine:cation symporter family protein [Cytophaga aurantiaca]